VDEAGIQANGDALPVCVCVLVRMCRYGTSRQASAMWVLTDLATKCRCRVLVTSVTDYLFLGSSRPEEVSRGKGMDNKRKKAKRGPRREREWGLCVGTAGVGAIRICKLEGQNDGLRATRRARTRDSL
jgi:hypothetical protein